MRDVAQERSGWRDEALSLRHRQWGWDCPAIDIDFLLLEYDQAKAVALIEYKNEHAKMQHASHPSYQALIDLANRAELPIFAVRYASDFSWYRVTPLNNFAKNHLSKQIEIDESHYIELLYRLRNRHFKGIDNEIGDNKE